MGASIFLHITFAIIVIEFHSTAAGPPWWVEMTLITMLCTVNFTEHLLCDQLNEAFYICRLISTPRQASQRCISLSMSYLQQMPKEKFGCRWLIWVRIPEGRVGKEDSESKEVRGDKNGVTMDRLSLWAMNSVWLEKAGRLCCIAVHDCLTLWRGRKGIYLKTPSPPMAEGVS